MALYGKIRDITLFKKINNELINNIIDTKIEIYRLDADNTSANIYGESDKKIYLNPIRINCLISSDEQSNENDEFGYNANQNIKFIFSRDELISLNCYIDVGDIVYWNNNFWELDHKIENQIFMKRNPNTNLDLSRLYGWNISIILTGHMTQRNKLNII